MRYKSQTNRLKFIGLFLIVLAIILYFIITSFFSFVSFAALPISGGIIIISILLIILSSLQWYEIQDDKVICKHMTKFEIPFKEIKQINLISVQSNVRVRYGNPKAFGTGIRLGVETAKSSVNATKEKLENVSKILDKYNQQTSLAKLKIYNIQTLIISSDNGEFRILPIEMEEFLIELNAKYKKNTGKKLKIDSSQIIT